MKQFIISSILFPLVLCQNYGNPAGDTTTTAATSATATSAAAGSVPTIVVAKSGLTFTPNAITAAQGSKVVFQFAQVGHTVTQAAFDAPCVPSNATGAINSGLSSTNEGPNVRTLDVFEDFANA
jgi:plastocyanin